MRAAVAAAGERARQVLTPECLAAWQGRDAAARPRPTLDRLHDGGSARTPTRPTGQSQPRSSATRRASVRLRVPVLAMAEEK